MAGMTKCRNPAVCGVLRHRPGTVCRGASRPVGSSVPARAAKASGRTASRAGKRAVGRTKQKTKNFFARHYVYTSVGASIAVVGVSSAVGISTAPIVAPALSIYLLYKLVTR